MPQNFYSIASIYVVETCPKFGVVQAVNILILCDSSLKQLNKTEPFTYKGGCG